MAAKSRAPLVMLAGGAAVAALAVLVLAQSWSGAPAPASVRQLSNDHGIIGGYRLATLYDVTDSAQVLVLPGDRAPTARLSLQPSAEGGWNLALAVTNFVFAETVLETKYLEGQGHAQLWLDGEYRTTFPGSTLFLPPLDVGSHELAVLLTTTDFRAYVRDGRVLVERMVMRFSDPRRGRLSAPREVEVAVRDGRAAPGDTVRVKQGETVQLRWTADAPTILHLEGYDMEAQVGPRSPVSMLFVADIAGRFPVEQHTDAGGHGRGALLYVEVLP